jgi:hypothetical protein
MYELQKPFVLRDYILMSSFLNIFLYKGISQNLFGEKPINFFFILLNKYLFINLNILDIQDTTSSSNSLFRSCRTLLMVLYRRDCRRSFAPTGHWLIGDLKTSSFFNELKKGRKIYSVLNFFLFNYTKKNIFKCIIHVTFRFLFKKFLTLFLMKLEYDSLENMSLVKKLLWVYTNMIMRISSQQL